MSAADWKFFDQSDLFSHLITSDTMTRLRSGLELVTSWLRRPSTTLVSTIGRSLIPGSRLVTLSRTGRFLDNSREKKAGLVKALGGTGLKGHFVRKGEEGTLGKAFDQA